MFKSTEKIQIKLMWGTQRNFSCEKHYIRLHSDQSSNVFAYSRRVFACINYYLASLDLAKLNIAKVKNPLKSLHLIIFDTILSNPTWSNG